MVYRQHCQVIAEAGVNHNGDLELALQLVDAAAAAGADFVKFQTFSANRLASQLARKVGYQQKNAPSESVSQLEMLQKLELTPEQHLALIERCAEQNIGFLSSCFDLDSLHFLETSLNVKGHKLGSGELTNAPLLLAVAQTQKPLILSTGMSNLGEIEQALAVLTYGYSNCSDPIGPEAFRLCWQDPVKREYLKDKVTLLHCTTEYPAPMQSINLNALKTMRHSFGLPVGYSDHTIGATASIAAVAAGAVAIEKHLTLDTKMPGPDHKASMEPDDFKDMVAAIRDTELAMGSPIKSPGAVESKNISEVRKSLVAAANIKKGELFTEKNVTVKRPGYGRSPQEYWSLLGQASPCDYTEDELI